MTSEIDRILRTIGSNASTSTETDVKAFEDFWNVNVPSDLKAFWRQYGTCEGFMGAEDEGPYVVLYAPTISIKSFGKETLEYMPKGLAAIGSDGGGEMFIFAEGKGYGLLANIHGGMEDFILVDKTFEGFLLKLENDSCYDGIGEEQ